MARPGQEAVHAITGDKIRYLEVGGDTCRIELIRRPGRFSMGEHYQAVQTETFEVISGTAKYIANGMEGTLVAGQKVVFPLGTPHVNPWSDDGELHIIQTLSPALDFDVLHESLYVEAPARGHTRPDGRTKLLPQAVIMHYTKSKAYTPRLPEAFQRVLFAVLAPVGLLLGYRYGTGNRQAKGGRT